MLVYSWQWNLGMETFIYKASLWHEITFIYVTRLYLLVIIILDLNWLRCRIIHVLMIGLDIRILVVFVIVVFVISSLILLVL